MKKKLTIKTYDLFMYVYFFLIFFYVFNISIINQIHNTALVSFFIIFISFFLLIVLNFKYLKVKRTNLFACLTVLFMIVTIRNGDLANNTFINYIYFITTIISIYFLSLTNKWHKIALKVFYIFVLEHIVASIFCYIFPNFYIETIMPLFPKSKQVLTYQFMHSQIAGFTQHYSTNALYLVSGLLVNTATIINDKKINKKRSMFLIINMLALLLTGKRSQVVSYILSILFVLMIKYKTAIVKYLGKIFIISVVAVLSLLVASKFIPSITNSFVRSYESISDTNVMNSRNILYNLAIDEFNDNKIIGIGWNNYKYVYNQKIPDKIKETDYMSVHNIYLQTLCETGILGFTIIFSMLFCLSIKSTKDLNKSQDSNATQKIYMFIVFHIFFLLEGIFGNSFYDLQTYTPYSIVLAMYLFYHYNLKEQK